MVANSQIIKFKQLIEIKEKLNVQFLSHPSHILKAQEPLLATWARFGVGEALRMIHPRPQFISIHGPMTLKKEVICP